MAGCLEPGSLASLPQLDPQRWSFKQQWDTLLAHHGSLEDTEGWQRPAFGSSAEMPLGPTHWLGDRRNYARSRSRMKIVIIIALGLAELNAAGMVLPDTNKGLQLPAFGSSTNMLLGPTHGLGDRIFYARPNSRMKIVIITIGLAELRAAGTVLDVPINAAIGLVE
jgi:hypothetical protein